ncbi:MAG: hypothetical protein ABEL76_16530 [Bradymonadaceae bacterium]
MILDDWFDRGRPSFAFLASLLVFGASTSSCTCSGAGAPPPTPKKRLRAISGTLPADTEAFSIIADIPAFREDLEAIDRSFGDVVSISDTLVRPLKTQLGIDPREKKQLKKSGVAPNGAVGLASVDHHPVLYTYVRNRQKFEKQLRDQLKQSRGLSSAPTTKSVDGTTLKLLGEGRKTVGWSYRDALGIVVLPPLGGKTGVATTETVLKQIATSTPDKTLLDDSGFKHFRRAAEKPTTFAYFNPAFLKSKSLSGTAARATDAIESAVDGTALLLSSRGSGASVRVWTGFNPDAADRLGQLHSGAPAASWAKLATDKTMLGARVSVDWKRAWNAIKALAPEGPRRNVQRRLDRLMDPIGLDPEDDVIEKLNGQMAAFFYGVGPNFTIGTLSRRPGRALRRVGLIASVEFVSSDAVDTIVESVSKAGGDRVAFRAGKSGGDADSPVRVLEIGAASGKSGESGSLPPVLSWLRTAPVRVAVAGERLYVSTAAIGEDSLRQYVRGTRESSGALTDAEKLDLGSTFATEKRLTGLYLNVTRAQDNLGNKIPPLPTIQQVLSTVEEGLISIRPADEGQFIELSVDAVSSGGGGTDGSKGSGNDEQGGG